MNGVCHTPRSFRTRGCRPPIPGSPLLYDELAGSEDRLARSSGSFGRRCQPSTLRPVQSSLGARALLGSDGRAGSFESLDEGGDGSSRVKTGEDVEMGLDHPDFQDVGSLFSGHGPQKPAEEPGDIAVNEPFAVSSGPDQVYRIYPASGIPPPETRRSHVVPSSDFSRAAGSARSSADCPRPVSDLRSIAVDTDWVYWAG